MTSPFPGMDPYLEGYLWPDVHNGIAFIIKELLGPMISPKYVARMELYTVEDTNPEEEIGIMYPDVEVLRQSKAEDPAVSSEKKGPLTITPITIRIPSINPVEVRIPRVEIRDKNNNQLITVIEILSPVNKRPPGLAPYLQKRSDLHKAGIHLLEIDLLRRGRRTINHPFTPKSHYLVSLLRAGTDHFDVWSINIQDPLPDIPVPLKAPDPDVVLSLGKVLELLYERSLYHLSIDYSQAAPPPAFSIEDSEWIKKLFNKP